MLEDDDLPGGTSEDESEEELRDEDEGELRDEDEAPSAVSFEDILNVRSRVGTKACRRLASGGGRRPAQRKRLNKNRPAEVSAKKRAPFLRQVAAAANETPHRDPRFDDLSGEYKADIFEQTYGFIHHIRRRETHAIEKQLRKTKNGDKKEQLNLLLGKMANQERARQDRERQRAGELQHKQEQRERANRGARPFFLNKSDQKKQRLAASFSALKTSGKLSAFLGKKRKRNAGKDRRKLPWQQQRQHAPR